MNREDEAFEFALRLEAGALGWRADAERYTGWRRQWRLDKAQALMDRCNRILTEFTQGIIDEMVGVQGPMGMLGFKPHPYIKRVFTE